MSHPKKTEPRCKQLNLSLTASELDSVQRRAAAVGMRTVHFGRAVLLDPIRKPSSHADTENATSRLIYTQLARLGNLLNQITRHLHRTGDHLPAELEPLLAEIRRLIARVPR